MTTFDGREKKESPLRVRIASGKLVLGLGLIALGASVIGFYYFSLRGPAPDGQGLAAIWPLLAMLGVFLGGWASIVAGAAIMYTAPMEICAACDRKLVGLTAHFPVALFQDLTGWLTDTTPKALTSLRMAPATSPSDPEVAGIELHVCPACRRTGWLAACKLGTRAGKRVVLYQGEILSKPADVMEALVRIAEARGGPTWAERESRSEAGDDRWLNKTSESA